MKITGFLAAYRHTLVASAILFFGSVAAMTAITFHFSSSPTAIVFHLAFLIPIAYSILTASLLATFITNQRLARLAVFIAWSLPSIMLVVTYVMYYVALTNWGLPMDYKMMGQNLPELPYLINALPFNSNLLYAVIAIPFTLIFIWFLVESKKILREVSQFRTTFFDRKTVYLVWLLPAAFMIAVYATPYFQDQINGPFRTLDDPLLSLFRLKKVQKRHIIQGVGRNHMEAEANYRDHGLQHRPNVVFIICDALRADHLSGYGYPRKTSPFLDSLMNCANCFAHPRYFSNTSVSFTGITGTLGSKEAITLNSFLLHEVLKKQGYRTSFFLSGDFISFYNLREYLGNDIDIYHDGYSYRNNPYAGARSSADDEVLVAGKLRQLEDWNGTPNFFYLHYMSTHQGGFTNGSFDVHTPHEYSLTERNPSVFINEYDNRVIQLDHYLKESISILDKKGYLEDAIIVVTADHGQALLENGHLWHSHSTDMGETFIPFIVSRTGPTPLPEKRLPTISDQTDAAPTVLDVLGLPKPASWEGTSMFQDNTGNAVYQNETGQYSVISPVKNRLIQLTYHAKDQAFQVVDVSDPSTPFTTDSYDKQTVDSLKTLLREHFSLNVTAKID